MIVAINGEALLSLLLVQNLGEGNSQELLGQADLEVLCAAQVAASEACAKLQAEVEDLETKFLALQEDLNS